MLDQCHSLLDCSSFLLVCAFYGYSLAFLNYRYTVRCGLGLLIFLLALFIVGIGPAPWWSISSSAIGFALTKLVAPISGDLLPIKLTAYELVNTLIFFIPFIPVIIAAGQASNDDALAMLVLTSGLLSLPWTLFIMLAKLLDRPTENAGAFLYTTWFLGGVALMLSSLLVLFHWALA